MSFFDRLKSTLVGGSNTLRAKAGDAVDQHGDKIDRGLDKASGAVSKATNGKYDDKIDKGVGKAKEGLHKRNRGGDGGNGGVAGR